MLLVIMKYRDKIYLPNSITRKINKTMVFGKKYSEPHRAKVTEWGQCSTFSENGNLNRA